MLSGLKQAEDGTGIVLHCYELYGIPTNSAVISGALECDLLTEEPIAGANPGNYGPYEIKALYLQKSIL